ncbi:FAD-dependent oxidoreductase [Companilactobacillus mishanensis]|uniref:oxidoreductase n=1 Tax=Companilactobacillus mishanensis TaxID=2486008 RepID=UPI0015626B6A|nr:FAD-dependent oxidoreductase [Companilactobacillus mishanensis]
MYEKLFEPFKIGTLKLKNRLVVPAVSTLDATEEGACTEQYASYMERKAQGGWGLIIAEYYGVAPNVGFFARMNGIWNDDLIASHKKMVDRVHKAGAKIGAQINHSGRETYTGTTSENVVSSSPYRDRVAESAASVVVPRELTIPEIKKIVKQYGDTAVNLKKAGFDLVEIYGAHGYLISQFLSGYANKRTDEYGGPLENRMKFLLEIVAEIRNRCGEDFPLSVRLSTEEYVPGGLTLGETRVICQKLEKAGVDLINCSQGLNAVSWNAVEPMYYDHAVFVDNAEDIKKSVSIPVMAAGRITEPSVAEAALTSGKCDLVGMARASLADPDFPKKVKEGKLDEIRYCIGCLQGCLANNYKGIPCKCLVNPELNEEYRFKITDAKKQKNIWIAGAGIAGCEAAIIAARRGHHVTIFEKSDHVGGTWVVAGLPLHKQELNTFLVWQRGQLTKLNVNIEFNTELTPEMVEKGKPDSVIVATGCTPFIPPIKGHDRDNVVKANDVLENKATINGNVVVLGGGSVGGETAAFCAWYGAKHVSIIEMKDKILDGFEREPKHSLKQLLEKEKVSVYTSSKVTEIGKNFVSFNKNGNDVKLDNISYVVAAVGSKSVNNLEEPLKKQGVTVSSIGDAKEVRNGLKAIREGYLAGYNA